MPARLTAIRTLSLTGAAIAAIAVAPQATSAADAPTPKRPNIVLVILDDVGLDSATDMYPGLIDSLTKQYGPSGLNDPDYAKIAGKPASTPVLDKFASEGVTFSQAWAQPFCSPTRASMLTGLFASKTGVRDYTNYLTQHTHSLAQDLKAAGYSTAIFGKWHMAGLNVYPGLKPKQASFDLFRGNLNGALDDYWDYDYQVQDDSTPADQWRDEKAPANSLPGMARTTYAPVTKAADAIGWMTEQEKAHKPWFAWFAFNMSHITAGRTHAPTIAPDGDTLDRKSYDEIAACHGQFGSFNIGDCSAPALNRAMNNSMDTVVGKLLDAIEHLDPNTYVIILGDNGTPMYGRAGTNFIDNMYIKRDGRAKGTGYESGVRVPLAIRGPGIKPGTSDASVHVVDLFSTILDFAHAPVPKTVPEPAGAGDVPVDSRSLAPIVFGQARTNRDPVHDYVVSETSVPTIQPDGKPGPSSQHHVAVRNATYKVLCIQKGADDSCQFYNLVKDPLEEYPLKLPAKCPAKVSVNFAATDETANYCFLRQAVRTQSGL